MHIQILMPTFNGVKHIEEQLNSIRFQSHEDWSLWISDDGSTDETLDVIAQFSQKVTQSIHVFSGPRRGVVANVFYLLAQLPQIDDCALAFADQDDVWLADKLYLANVDLEASSSDIPHLHCGTSLPVNNNLRPIGKIKKAQNSKGFRFENALIQSIAAAHTMVLNHTASTLLKSADYSVLPAWHDWWVYILVTGAGGRITYSHTPQVLYRQHDFNRIGVNLGTRATLERISLVLSGELRRWNSQNITALTNNCSLLSFQHVTKLEHFTKARSTTGIDAIKSYNELGLYRQSRIQHNIAKWAMALGKL